MRDIKFRYFDKHNDDFIYISTNHDMEYWFEGAKEFPEKPLSMEEYTGLKDKTGKEIYESDIVNIITTPASPYEEDFVSVVEFKDGCFHVKDPRDTTELCLSVFPYEASNGYKPLRIEVIGNVHQNQELLG